VQHNATGLRQELIERKRFRIDLMSSKVINQNISSLSLKREFSQFKLEYKNVSKK
jgi:hypothetical protein